MSSIDVAHGRGTIRPYRSAAILPPVGVPNYRDSIGRTGENQVFFDILCETWPPDLADLLRGCNGCIPGVSLTGDISWYRSLV
jgi:hypothetical protein